MSKSPQTFKDVAFCMEYLSPDYEARCRRRYGRKGESIQDAGFVVSLFVNSVHVAGEDMIVARWQSQARYNCIDLERLLHKALLRFRRAL